MKFKIGDLVERIKLVPGVEEYPVGSLGVVKGVSLTYSGEAWSVDVLFNGSLTTWGCLPNTLRVIHDETEEISLSCANLAEVL